MSVLPSLSQNLFCLGNTFPRNSLIETQTVPLCSAFQTPQEWSRVASSPLLTSSQHGLASFPEGISSLARSPRLSPLRPLLLERSPGPFPPASTSGRGSFPSPLWKGRFVTQKKQRPSREAVIFT